MNPWVVGVLVAAGAGGVWKVGKRLFGRSKRERRRMLAVLRGIGGYFQRAELFDHLEAATSERLPHEPGIYAWYFDEIPPKVKARKCSRVEGWTWLYVGLSSDLHRRILSEHFLGNPEGSSLCRTLGCLLRNVLSIQLCKTGRSARWTFGKQGQDKLSSWMTDHARVGWLSIRNESVSWPWQEGDLEGHVLERVERWLINEFVLPLNIKHNRPSVCNKVKGIVEDCKENAPDLDE